VQRLSTLATPYCLMSGGPVEGAYYAYRN
jgi:hypothetical protein